MEKGRTLLKGKSVIIQSAAQRTVKGRGLRTSKSLPPAVNLELVPFESIAKRLRALEIDHLVELAVKFDASPFYIFSKD